MNIVLSIISLFTFILSWGLNYFLDSLGLLDHPLWGLVLASLVYILFLLYDIFTIRYCLRVRKEKHTSIIPVIISVIGTVLHILGIAVFIFGMLIIYNQYPG